MRRSLKVSIALSSFVFSLGVLQSHAQAQLYPGLAVGFALATLIVLVGTVWGETESLHAIPVLIYFGLLYRVYIFLFPASMIAFDPDSHAVSSHAIAMAGNLSMVPDVFYKNAPLFRILGAEAKLLFGVPVDVAYVVFPIGLTVAVAALSVAIVRQVTSEDLPAVLAATVIVLFPPMLKFVFAPIPMAMGMALATTIFFVVLSARLDPQSRHLVALFVLALAATLTHKIPILLVFAVLCSYMAYTWSLRQFTEVDVENHLRVQMITLFGTLLFIQWVYFTQFVEVAGLLLIGLRTIGRELTTTPTHAVEVSHGILGTVRNIGYFPITVGAAGVTGTFLLGRPGRQRLRFLLVASAVSVSMAIPDLFVSAPGTQRVILYGLPFVAALCGIGLNRLIKSGHRYRRTAGIVLVGLIVVVNPLGMLATPDHPGNARLYLSQSEVAAKQFGNTRADVVHMDMFYGDEVVDFDRAARGPAWHQMGVPHPSPANGLMSTELKNGTLLDKEYGYVAIRQQVDSYRLVGGHYRLTWSPSDALNKSYHTVYDSGGTRLYDRPRNNVTA